ncbi:MAG: DUF4178 domain-containing protein [Atopobiaceae bacterium]|nr:DUF4178 domain-containing protein [Atopobiaceae bacterium]
MNFVVGHDISVKGVKYLVLGSILYKDRQQGDEWEEYRLRNSNDESEWWLSFDTGNDEYEMSFMVGRSRPPAGFSRVDSGTQVVRIRYGSVDVDNGETARYETWEDAAGVHTFSVERWSDGTEYSRGMYVERGDIQDLGPSPDVKDASKFRSDKSGASGCSIVACICIVAVVSVRLLLMIPSKSEYETDVCSLLDRDSTYTVVEEASDASQPDVKTYATSYSVDVASNYIIQKLEGYVRNVRENDDKQTVALLTDNEYILVYKDAGEDGLGVDEERNDVEGSTKTPATGSEDAAPDDGAQAPEDASAQDSASAESTTEAATAETADSETNGERTLVQVSSRKYAYTTDRRPYHARHSSYLWYRRFYRAIAYAGDKESFKGTESSYSHYTGETAIDSATTSSYESYANSIRQESMGTKRSSDGGTSYGK